MIIFALFPFQAEYDQTCQILDSHVNTRPVYLCNIRAPLKPRNL